LILVDTNVLIYAVGMEHMLREPCRLLLGACANGLVQLSTTVEVVQEFVHVRSRYWARSDAVALAHHYCSMFGLLTTRVQDLELGLILYQAHPQLGAFDAVLAAVALNHEAQALVSADQAFAHVSNLNWIDPATPALARLLPSP
jgi:predicted nucleic acid-binding protein